MVTVAWQMEKVKVRGESKTNLTAGVQNENENERRREWSIHFLFVTRQNSMQNFSTFFQATNGQADDEWYEMLFLSLFFCTPTRQDNRQIGQLIYLLVCS